MEAVYYNNTFFEEEATAVCQEIYRVTLLSTPERAAQMLFCQQFCHTPSTNKTKALKDGQPQGRFNND